MEFLYLCGEQVEEPALGSLVLPHRQVLHQIIIPTVRHLVYLDCDTAKTTAKYQCAFGGFPFLEPPIR